MMLSEFGRHLTGRFIGRKIKEQILSNPGNVVIDFHGVESISHSFADEVFGKLFMELGDQSFRNKIKITNCSDEIRTIIKFVLKERNTTMKQTCVASQ
jgi:anti-anti-sigma regulatory factor